jgi:hypothetical protein
MDDNNSPQPPTNDPYAPLNQPAPPVPGAGVPNPQPQQPAPQPAAPQAPEPSVTAQQPVAEQPAASQRPPLRIDHNLLAELGLAALPDEEKKALEKHIYETLEMRVGMRLADQMTNEQLDEFETYFNARDDAGAFRWLETNFPNYKDIVAEEFDKLKDEVAGQAPAILAASQQQLAGQGPAPSQPAPDTYQPQQPAAYTAETPPAQPQQPPQPMPPQQPQPMSPPTPPQWPTPPSADQQPPQAPTQ